MTPDMVNGGIELFGAFLTALNVVRLHRDKLIKGVHWLPVMFFTVWGVWNLFYYPSLDQWFSFAGGVVLVVVNFVWLCQMIYYSKQVVPA